MIKRRHMQYKSQSACSVEATLEVIGGKWKGAILHHLVSSPGVLRFSELQKMTPDLSPRILTAQLRKLEADGVILRKVYPVVPPKVEYSLSVAGQSLEPLIRALQEWGDEYLMGPDAPLGRPADVNPGEPVLD